VLRRASLNVSGQSHTLTIKGERKPEARTRRLPVINPDGTLVGLLSLDDLACEAARTLRGEVNDELRNLVLEVHLAIHAPLAASVKSLNKHLDRVVRC
jgi:hypothetical protein